MICPECKCILVEKRQVDTDPQFIYFSCSCEFSETYETTFFGSYKLNHDICQKIIDDDFQRKINPKGRHKLMNIKD